MVLTEYVVAIPSYHRENTLKKKTLRVLQEYKIDPNKIIIFVADKGQEKVYRDALDKATYNTIVVGRKGIKNIRNFMPRYFPEGQHILYMDDDINRIYDTINNGDPRDKKDNKQIPLMNLNKLIDTAFALSVKNKIHNWGVYPANNPFFMKPRRTDNSHISTKLSFLIGFMNGVINHRKTDVRTTDEKEDYERSIRYYLKDNGIIRFNNITCGTRCYKESGGMEKERSVKRSAISSKHLIKLYPNLCSLNTNATKSGYTEIRLRDRRPDIKPPKVLSSRLRTKKKSRR